MAAKKRKAAAKKPTRPTATKSKPKATAKPVSKPTTLAKPTPKPPPPVVKPAAPPENPSNISRPGVLSRLWARLKGE